LASKLFGSFGGSGSTGTRNVVLGRVDRPTEAAYADAPAMASARIVVSFEDELAQHVPLSVFVPAVV
jgi:hypothetical protein